MGRAVVGMVPGGAAFERSGMNARRVLLSSVWGGNLVAVVVVDVGGGAFVPVLWTR